MFRNYLKIAWRNLWKHKLFSFINLLGLAMSMAVGLIVIIIIKEAYSYDKFHPQMDRFYRVITDVYAENNSVRKFASTPLPLAEKIKTDYGENIETATRIKRGIISDMSAGDKVFEVEGFFAEPTFFQLFGFDLEKGDEATALSEPYSIILSEESAAKFFKNENPVGRTVHLKQFEADFIVSGVLKKREENSHFLKEVYVSWSSIAGLERAGKINPSLNNWNDYRTGYTFIRFKKGTKRHAFTNELAVLAKNINSTIHGQDFKGYKFQLQPVSKISPPAEMLEANLGGGRQLLFLYICMAIGLIVLLSACFNYTNLSIARSLARAREVGVRKVSGAKRSQIFFQFLTEAIVISLIALGLAYVFLRLFGNISFISNIISSVPQGIGLWIYFFIFSIITGLLAGSLPAWVLSSFRPVQVLKTLQGVKVFKGLTLRKTLIVIQFSVSLIFMIMLSVIYAQSRYMLSTDYGFDQKDFIHISLQGNDYKKLNAELARNSQVKEVTASSSVLGTYMQNDALIKADEDKEPIKLGYFSVDKNFTSVMNLHLVAGTSFPSNASDSNESYVILNEKAVQLLHFGDPQEAIGKMVSVEETSNKVALAANKKQLEVIGVVEDFFYQNMMFDMGAMALRYMPAQFQIVNVKLNRPADKASIAALSDTWKTIDGNNEFQYSLYEDEFENIYGQRDSMSVLLFLTLLTITLSCLGILGITTYTAETRAKEIGIRKVMGANVRGIVFLLSRNLLILLVTAGVVALPVAYIISKSILQQFANRIEPGAVVLGIPFLLMVFLALLTVGSQTLKIALANPVKSLRTE